LPLELIVDLLEQLPAEIRVEKNWEAMCPDINGFVVKRKNRACHTTTPYIPRSIPII
jgi:hypothetical protein